ncbi:DeoR/GlpR family DNA-binding transcription regulator [Hydrotalea sp.]|uniref:DeoR/GlpR family DNA-binding transcription regulator n=1 Tax=Hydrotalea sp. TaxID=2881279 RepID=UPI00262353A2|nr:DeoR/GlpR family DNA-binding transcription regulator [Hydrotalea sp.]
MLKKERQAYILQQINIHNKVLSSDLSVQMNVSEDTIRRDLQELDEQGKITKVHGGALSKAFHFTLQSNVVYQQTEKRMIAQKAIALLRDGMFILLSGGTTIVEMVKILPKELNVTFITVSLPVALELLNHPNCQVVFLGNLLSKNAQIAIGAEVVTRLNEITADICFLGTNSIDAEKGITDLEWEVIEVKRAMINSALKTVSLAISEKVNTVQRLQVCKLEAIHTLITELDSTDPRLAPYKEAGLQIL